MPVYREEAKKLEERVQDFDKLKDMEERVGDLERELHWALVYEIESVRFQFTARKLNGDVSNSVTCLIFTDHSTN